MTQEEYARYLLEQKIDQKEDSGSVGCLAIALLVLLWALAIVVANDHGRLDHIEQQLHTVK
jgi:hypothetical protein